MPWRRKWLPTPIFLPGKSHGQSSLAGYGLWVPRVGQDLATKPPPAKTLTPCLLQVSRPHPVQQFPFLNLPWWLSGKEPACQCRRYSFDSWVEDPLEKGMATPVFLCRKTHGQSSLVHYSPQGHKTHKKSQT